MNETKLVIPFLIFLHIFCGFGKADSFKPVLDKSQFQIKVYRSGLLKKMGHDHLVRVKDYKLDVDFQSEKPESISIHLEINADQLTVLDPSLDAETRGKVEKDMKSEKVLNISEYPKITFTVQQFRNPVKSQDEIRGDLEGELALHGVKKSVHFPVLLKITSEGLHAKGQVQIRQTDFGIKPVSVGLGTIRVKNEIDIIFDLVLTH